MTGTGGIEQVALVLRERQPAVALTGAGMSTASGISDFRSPGGIWSRHQPVTIQEFMASEDARKRYWEYKRVTYDEFAGALPNPAHEALARLERAGRLTAVITQNIDGLHQEAGSRRVVELHGTNRRVICLSCDRSFDRAAIQDRLVQGEVVPRCEACSGFLKPATVSFGQTLPDAVLTDAVGLAQSCGCFLAVGSSLVVYPAAELPLAAKRARGALVVINREPTPVDAHADLVIHGEVSEVLPELAARVLDPGPG
jgi:NAD-dependent deacetylase